MGSLFALLVAGLIVGTLTSVGQSVASGVANKRSREAQATINQENVEAQKEINQQNIDLQRSAIPDKFNQLTSLGMSRGAALQAVSGASYSPSSVATTQQAYQEQPLDLSGFGTLGNMLQMAGQFDQQMAETKRMNDAELALKEQALEQAKLDTWEKQYGKDSKEVRDKILEYVFNPANNIGADKLRDVRSLMASLPDDLREDASKYDIPNVVLSNLVHDYQKSNFEQLNLGMLVTESELKLIQKQIAESERDLALVENAINAENYPTLAKLNLAKLAAEVKEANANANYADMLAKAGLTEAEAVAAKAELDGDFYRDHPKLYKFTNWLSHFLSPVSTILGSTAQGVSTAVAVRGMNRPGKKK